MAADEKRKVFNFSCANKECPGKLFSRPFTLKTQVVSVRDGETKAVVHIQCPHCAKNLFSTIDMDKEDNTEFATFLDSKPDADRHAAWVTFQDTQRQTFTEKINTQANTFNTLFTGVFGIYTLVLFFFGLSTSSSGGSLVLRDGSPTWLFFLPIIFWLAGAAILIVVTRPITGEVISDSDESYIKALDKGNFTKATLFSIGMILFAIGLVIVIVPVITGIASGPAVVPQEKSVQFIVSEEAALALKDIPIGFESANKTVPMYLVNTTDSSYEVRLANNDTFSLKKEWVKVMVVRAGNETRPAVLPGTCPSNQSVIGINETGGIICGP